MNGMISIRLRGSPRMENFASLLHPGEKAAILRALGAKFKFMTVMNFGYNGISRPSPWKRLSQKYAKRVKRESATLDLSGDLMRSLRVSAPDENSITVYTDNEYAEAHQFGNAKLPSRPFMPINRDGSATPYAQRVLETTAALELQKQMRRLG